MALWITIDNGGYWFNCSHLYFCYFIFNITAVFMGIRSDDIMSDDVMYGWIVIGTPFLIYAFYLLVTR